MLNIYACIAGALVLSKLLLTVVRVRCFGLFQGVPTSQYKKNYKQLRSWCSLCWEGQRSILAVACSDTVGPLLIAVSVSLHWDFWSVCDFGNTLDNQNIVGNWFCNPLEKITKWADKFDRIACHKIFMRTSFAGRLYGTKMLLLVSKLGFHILVVCPREVVWWEKFHESMLIARWCRWMFRRRCM